MGRLANYYYYYYYCYSARKVKLRFIIASELLVFHTTVCWRSFTWVWLSTRADLTNDVVWMVSISSLISITYSPFLSLWEPFQTPQLLLVSLLLSCSTTFFVLERGPSTCLSVCFFWLSLYGPMTQQSRLYGRFYFILSCFIFLLILTRSCL